MIPPGSPTSRVTPDDGSGRYRHGELTRALDRIGAVMHVLGADEAAGRLSRYRDSGMVGSPAAARPEAFAAADLDVAGGLVAERRARRCAPTSSSPTTSTAATATPTTSRPTASPGAPSSCSTPRDRPARVYEILTPLGWAREDRAWLAAADPAPARHGRVVGPQDLGPGAPAPPRLVVPGPTTRSRRRSSTTTASPTPWSTRPRARSRATRCASTRPRSSSRARTCTPSPTSWPRGRPRREGFRRVDPLTWETVGGPVEPGRGAACSPDRASEQRRRLAPATLVTGPTPRGASLRIGHRLGLPSCHSMSPARRTMADDWSDDTRRERRSTRAAPARRGGRPRRRLCGPLRVVLAARPGLGVGGWHPDRRDDARVRPSGHRQGLALAARDPIALERAGPSRADAGRAARRRAHGRRRALARGAHRLHARPAGRVGQAHRVGPGAAAHGRGRRGPHGLPRPARARTWPSPPWRAG